MRNKFFPHFTRKKHVGLRRLCKKFTFFITIMCNVFCISTLGTKELVSYCSSCLFSPGSSYKRQREWSTQITNTKEQSYFRFHLHR
ncbi:hypothetical protein HanIR_Chr06g0294141 [Helianthus annuus]|nr:hypothetical protein HanIR_Chr06g0294141 [Helianthus annuus]